MTDLAFEHAPIGELRCYHRNPRKGDVDRIRESLVTNGQYRALAVNRGTHTGRPNEVLAGNHTLLAARDLGWETVAVTYVDVDDDQAARIVVVDNRSAEVAENDDELLAELLADLPDLEGTGYRDDEFEALQKALAAEQLPTRRDTDPDEIPDPPPEPHCQPGDVWELGPHRLVVGDSTDVGAWDALLAGEKADAMWTDPPYGVSYVGKTKQALTIDNDSMGADDIGELLRAVFSIALVSCREGAAWYVASPPGPLMLQFAGALAEMDVLRQTLIWVKDVFVLGHSDYHYKHEPIFYGWTPGASHHAPPDRKQDTVHEIARPKRSEDHPTMKPVELIQLHLSNSTDALDIVVDPFGGSGSTLIACHQLNRKARLIELDPRYADVICRRFQEHSGVKPTRDGEPHDFTTTTDENAD